MQIRIMNINLNTGVILLTYWLSVFALITINASLFLQSSNKQSLVPNRNKSNWTLF